MRSAAPENDTSSSETSARARELNAAARANVETGVLLLCKECLVTAIQDRRLERAHLRVLACLVQFLNRQTAKAWPDRRTIAKALNLEPETVSNTLRELRLLGYLIAERERVEAANNRSLTVYTLGNIDHDTIRREIQSYVDRIKSEEVTARGDFEAQKSPQEVTLGTSREMKVTAGGGRKSPRAVDSNSEKELIRKEGGSAPVEYAQRNVEVMPSGKLAIGDELRNDLRAEGYSDNQINCGLERAPERAKSHNPLKLLNAIRYCASYAKQDEGAKSKQSRALSRWGAA